MTLGNHADSENNPMDHEHYETVPTAAEDLTAEAPVTPLEPSMPLPTVTPLPPPLTAPLAAEPPAVPAAEAAPSLAEPVAPAPGEVAPIPAPVVPAAPAAPLTVPGLPGAGLMGGGAIPVAMPTGMPTAPAPAPAPIPAGLPTAVPQPVMPSAPVVAVAPHQSSTHPTAPAPRLAPSSTTALPPQSLDLSALGLNEEQERSAHLLMEVLSSDESSEVIINGPNEVLQKKKGTRYHESAIKFGDEQTYHKVLNEVVLAYVDTADRIDGVNILVEGQMELPSGQPGVPPTLARVHVLAPPLVQFAKVTIAKKARYEFDLDAIQRTGAMTPQMAEVLKAVARGRLTFVASGPTGAGKTTLLQAMSHNFDQTDRLVIIEDTPELRLPLADTVYLTSTSAKPGLNPEDVVTTEWLVKAANRMRMDRIIVGECRGAEMAEWLIAANSGAEGSATTVHADTPRRALDKILGLATKSPTSGSETTLRREIAATVDIVVQAGLIDGKHVITHIEEVSKTVTNSGLIATTTLFEYNRARGMHEVKARPSEDLVNILRQRSVPLNLNLFR
jgi:Flp pilus assembly CpaF family ATPase